MYNMSLRKAFELKETSRSILLCSELSQQNIEIEMREKQTGKKLFKFLTKMIEDER